MSTPVIQVDFTRPAKQRNPNVLVRTDVRRIYLRPKSGKFVLRTVIHGRQKEHTLHSRSLSAAEREAGKLLAEQAAFKAGLGKDPFAVSDDWTCGQMLDYYEASGCPSCRKNRTASRTPQTLREEKTRIATLKEWCGKRPHTAINLETCWQYRDWRVARTKKGKSGLRQAEKDLTTLSNAFTWSVKNSSRTGVTSNPIARGRERFTDPAQRKKCREAMPRNADELHNIARCLFTGDPRSEVLGWLFLFQAAIGQRVHELLYLRWDAKTEYDPGFIKANHLFLFRSKTSKGTYPYARIHSFLEKLLDQLRAWRKANYPNSPWFFPSPEDPTKPVGASSLTHTLYRVAVLMGRPKGTWTSHGQRAYYVNKRRSDGIPDAQIALEIGQKSGGKLIVDVYGEILPYKLSWMPESKDTPVAWSKWLQVPPAAPQQMDLLPTPVLTQLGFDL